VAKRQPAKRTQPADLSRVKTVPIRRRRSKVNEELLAKVPRPGQSLAAFLDSLPDILKARDLREVGALIAKAHARGRGVVWMMGAHPIKCGLSPLIIDLIERGVITAVATNGAGAIHDSEMALFGQTSEDVVEGLADGSFGMARETGEFTNAALTRGHAEGIGAGEAIAKALGREKAPHLALSILAAAHRAGIPATVHIAIGTDITHQQPSADGAALGATSHHDFRLLCTAVERLARGGVVLNVGSTVILPEVFLKALTVARNLGKKVQGFTAANFDMIQHYRPNTNVVERPTQLGGRRYSFTGHHELMIPLLCSLILRDLK
jgi:hypothetical protein